MLNPLRRDCDANHGGPGGTPFLRHFQAPTCVWRGADCGFASRRTHQILFREPASVPSNCVTLLAFLVRNDCFQGLEHELKPNLAVSADCELHQLHAFGVLVKAPPWIVTAPSPTVLCSAYMIGLAIYGIKRPRAGNLSSRPTILLLKPNCLRWRRSARRSPITSKII